MFRLKPIIVLLAMLSALFVLNGCARPEGSTKADKISYIHKMRSTDLAELYKLAPGAKTHIASAYGYAVFNNMGINVFVVSTGQGYGVARNNKTGKDTYMKMFSAGVGVGLGVKDFRGIFVFANKTVFDRFVDIGWNVQGQADAAAKLDNKGGAVSVAIEVAPGIFLYQFTKSGLAAQATIQGTKFWKDKELN
ncbi:hypothetical protein AU255_17420 [Methyloprofundus sedimenti]|uniref:Ysc84 actin-binding domain-containing protein n=1 Tax=Methyloprofundus sedimenti TaxID=1420851 RepID=A0A1V8M121_9GAMM|nr:hypothetical protein [Methyloprofundus sedimenti]OQK15257.1 hypothetical protein AU255_17420 [Methyloprofundus sedimenti]